MYIYFRVADTSGFARSTKKSPETRKILKLGARIKFMYWGKHLKSDSFYKRGKRGKT